jgi:hypothetical protein
MDISNISFDDLFRINGKSACSLADEMIVSDCEYLTATHILNSETMSPIRPDALIFVLCPMVNIAQRELQNLSPVKKLVAHVEPISRD